ncbi:MAG: glycosyltransferase [Lachnospiraceae bacterium]|nr:glycosyltransferase [Lachnospiraceae bacterium]
MKPAPLSLCLIGKNEEAKIKETLTPLTRFLGQLPEKSEILFCDTGSTDQTVAIVQDIFSSAEKACQGRRMRQIDYAWQEDFSAARNFCMAQAANDMVLFVDCDEVLVEYDVQEIINDYGTRLEAVGMLSRDNHFQEKDGKPGIYVDWVPRLFSKRLYMYEGRIHEQVVARNHKPYLVYEIPFRTDHSGYIGTYEQMKAKTDHYASLLKKELAEYPENPYLYFQLGQCYNTLYDDETALHYYQSALQFELDPGAEYVEMLLNAIGHCLLHLDRLEEAMAFVNRYYDNYFFSSDLFCLAGSVRMRRGELIQAMLEYIKAITAPIHHREGTNNYIPYFNIACMYEAMGKADLALQNYERCGDYPPALEKIAALSAN